MRTLTLEFLQTYLRTHPRRQNQTTRLLVDFLLGSIAWLAKAARVSVVTTLFFLGNMSNPVVNRWGSNSIWYHFWYSDSIYAKQVSQDRILTQLLEIYLTYGLESHHLHFSNEYWYRKIGTSYPVDSYYRVVIITKEEVHMVTRHRFRKQANDVYKMRVWVLRYGKWWVINMYWFQPYKKRIIISRVPDKTPRNYIGVTSTAPTTSYQRLSALTALTTFDNLLSVCKRNMYVF